jgi:predicted HD superfamily hydrolase involved in NAD metabolism
VSINDLVTALRADLLARTPAKRASHVMGVEGMSVVLSRRWGVDPDRLLVAALLHDLTKATPHEEQLRLLDAARVVVPDEEDRAIPAVWHGYTAAQEGYDRLGIRDAGILRAVAYHSTGSPELDEVGLALYVADATEPSRHWDGVDVLRREVLACETLPRAAHCVALTKSRHVNNRNRREHPRTQAMIASLSRQTIPHKGSDS